MMEDRFDYHTYHLRETNLRVDVRLLQWASQLRIPGYFSSNVRDGSVFDSS